MPTFPRRRRGRLLDPASLARWQLSRRGRRLLLQERAELQRVLPDLFGRHILQIGNWGSGEPLLASTEMLHHAVLGGVGHTGAEVLVDLEALPILGHSIDAVLLPHTLEFVGSPHTLLREIDRVLTDRGKLLVLGFNPWSPFGLRERVGFGCRAFPRHAWLHGVGRLGDWLNLLDFEVQDVHRFGGRIVALSPVALFRPSYLLVARKRVVPIDRVGRLRRAQVRPIIGAAVPWSGARSERP